MLAAQAGMNNLKGISKDLPYSVQVRGGGIIGVKTYRYAKYQQAMTKAITHSSASGGQAAVYFGEELKGFWL